MTITQNYAYNRNSIIMLFPLYMGPIFNNADFKEKVKVVFTK